MTGFVWVMLWRETRASWKRLLLFVLSIAAGVGGLVAVKSFSFGLEGAIRVEARSLMAADISLGSHRPFSEPERAALEELQTRGAEIVRNVAFAAMASADTASSVRLTAMMPPKALTGSQRSALV